ncbi:hypothetical protein SEUCBS140593_005272 [Sporothrix eucalyptigena]|uniref:Uncharacterized protein n=1 Tax=Sporothrix eucalyptigena TaxID=1812306 RepID=A0ABP0BV34_9PEZI
MQIVNSTRYGQQASGAARRQTTADSDVSGPVNFAAANVQPVQSDEQPTQFDAMEIDRHWERPSGTANGQLADTNGNESMGPEEGSESIHKSADMKIQLNAQYRYVNETFLNVHNISAAAGEEYDEDMAWSYLSSRLAENAGQALSGVYVQSQEAAEVIVDYVEKGKIKQVTERTAGSSINPQSGDVYVYREGGSVHRWKDSRSWTSSRKGASQGDLIYREVKKTPKDGSTPSSRGGKIENIEVTEDNCERTLFVEPQDLVFNTIGKENVAKELVFGLVTGDNLLVNGLVKRTIKVHRVSQGVRTSAMKRSQVRHKRKGESVQSRQCGDVWTVVSYYNIGDVLRDKVLPIIAPAKQQ